VLATARLSTPNGTPPTTTQQVTAPSTATPHHANLGPMVVLLSPVSISKGTQPKTYQILKPQLLKPTLPTYAGFVRPPGNHSDHFSNISNNFD
jgi:hypothetical protein